MQISIAYVQTVIILNPENMIGQVNQDKLFELVR